MLNIQFIERIKPVVLRRARRLPHVEVGEVCLNQLWDELQTPGRKDETRGTGLETCVKRAARMRKGKDWPVGATGYSDLHMANTVATILFKVRARTWILRTALL